MFVVLCQQCSECMYAVGFIRLQQMYKIWEFEESNPLYTSLGPNNQNYVHIIVLMAAQEILKCCCSLSICLVL